MQSATVRAAGTEIISRNGTRRRKGPLDHIYVNPNVTREAQRQLATKLHTEITAEKELNESFRNRAHTSTVSDRSTDNAKIFNDFCVQFIDTSKDTKERVSDVLTRASERLKELEEARAHLEEVERRTYRFEMNLPDTTVSVEEEMDKVIADSMAEIKNKPKNELMDLVEKSENQPVKKRTKKVRVKP